MTTKPKPSESVRDPWANNPGAKPQPHPGTGAEPRSAALPAERLRKALDIALAHLHWERDSGGVAHPRVAAEECLAKIDAALKVV